MAVFISVAVAVCTLCAAGGYLCATLIHRRSPASANAPVEASKLSDKQDSDELRLIPVLVQQLQILTAQVGLQVTAHSARIGEITKTIVVSDEREALASSIVLAASQLLVTANQKLQGDLEEAKKEIQLQQEQLDDCLRDSLTDMLTALPNRRAFDQKIQMAVALSRRQPTPFSLMLIDIDHFKRVNDSYGHMVGDQLLKSISQRLSSSLREFDFIARYGGEEFVGILANTRLEEACEASDRIRRFISQEPYRISEWELPITVSVGVKEFSRGESAEDLFQRTDQALYAAKNGGRNCCYCFDGQGYRRFTTRIESPDGESESRNHRIELAHEPRLESHPVSTSEATDSHLTL